MDIKIVRVQEAEVLFYWSVDQAAQNAVEGRSGWQQTAPAQPRKRKARP